MLELPASDRQGNNITSWDRATHAAATAIHSCCKRAQARPQSRAQAGPSHAEKQPGRVLDGRLDVPEECHCLPTVN